MNLLLIENLFDINYCTLCDNLIECYKNLNITQFICNNHFKITTKNLSINEYDHIMKMYTYISYNKGISI